MVSMVLLLPPSEGKVSGGDESKVFRVVQNLKKYNSFKMLQSDREYVYETLRNAISVLSDSELEAVFD